MEEDFHEKGENFKHVKQLSHVNYDVLLSSAGEFGRYQYFLFFASFPFYVFGVFVYLGQIFMTETSPNHWCWIPELENLTEFERRSLAIPTDDKARFGYSQCSAYVANWTEVLITGNKPDHSWPTTQCSHGWEFNKSEIPYVTISSELGWVCERDSYQASAQSIFFVGSIVGGFVFGYVSDKYGRLPAIVCCNMLACLAGIGSAFATSFTIFALCRFLVGMGWDNCMMIMYLLSLEYVAPKYRTLSANLPFAIFFTSTLVTLPWIALACNNWRTFALVTSIPLGLTLLTPLIIPESPRWLLSKGRLDDTVKKVKHIAKVNKEVVPLDMIDQFKTYFNQHPKEENYTILELIKRPLLRKMFLLLCLEYMCGMVVLDALIRSVGSLQFDFFVSFTLTSLTEFPSILLLALVLDKTGRRLLTIVAFSLCCVFSILIGFVDKGFVSVIFVIISRLFVNMTTITCAQWAPEMLPTSVRGSGAAFVHICGYVATISSSFIAYLYVVSNVIPPIIIGCVAGLGAFIGFILPETANIDMPQTCEDSENLMRNHNVWKILPCRAKLGKKVETETG
ncbi:carcinine transporter-like [Amyelois transitella]|uniref:carcinine transporter-like n=1 Tax=Amyelois transitella TaxID=680683 RepID=UPI00298F54AC|nr:carcinine transporter-like [Amyelois transitella]